jgi:hypothetical protein
LKQHLAEMVMEIQSAAQVVVVWALANLITLM